MSQYTYNYDPDGVNQGVSLLGKHEFTLDCINDAINPFASFTSASPTGFTVTYDPADGISEAVTSEIDTITITEGKYYKVKFEHSGSPLPYFFNIIPAEGGPLVDAAGSGTEHTFLAVESSTTGVIYFVNVPTQSSGTYTISNITIEEVLEPGTAIVSTSGGAGVSLLPQNLITEIDCANHTFFLKDYSSFSSASPTGFTATHTSGDISFAYTGFGAAPEYLGITFKLGFQYKVTFGLEMLTGVGPLFGLGVANNNGEFALEGWQRATAGANEIILTWDTVLKQNGTISFNHLVADATSTFTISNIIVKELPHKGTELEYLAGTNTQIKNVSIGFDKQNMRVTAECDVRAKTNFTGVWDFEIWVEEIGEGLLGSTYARSTNTYPASALTEWHHHTLTWECGKDIEFATDDVYKEAPWLIDHGMVEITFKVTNPDGGTPVTVEYIQEVHLDLNPVEYFLTPRSPTAQTLNYGSFGADAPFFERYPPLMDWELEE